jgi:two-component system, OmpR family, response regulator
MKTKNQIYIYIVEDNAVYAESLKSVIQIHFPDTKIKIFRIGELCLLELHRNPLIVIMDYFLNSKYPEAQNGLEIIKHIKSQKPQTNIIVLSVQENISVVLDAIKQYGCIYVQKDPDAFKRVEQFIQDIFNREDIKSLETWN